MASMGGRYLVPRPRCMPGSAPTAAVSSVPIEDRLATTFIAGHQLSPYVVRPSGRGPWASGHRTAGRGVQGAFPPSESSPHCFRKEALSPAPATISSTVR